jgi:hypothetical protein
MPLPEADRHLGAAGYSYSNHVRAYRTPRAGDRSRIELQDMGAELGFIEVRDEIPGPIDLDRARSLLVERFGAPVEQGGAPGRHLVLSWQADDIRLSAAVAGSAERGEGPSLVRLQLWTTRLDDYQQAMVERCLQLRALPPGERTPEQVRELMNCPLSVFE